MKIIQILFLGCMLVFAWGAVNAQAAQTEKNYAISQLAMSEFLIGVGTRATAMGSAGAATIDDLASLYWNPAGLPHLAYPEIEINHHTWIQDTSQEVLTFGLPISPKLATAVGFNYFGLGSIEKTGLNSDGSILLENETLNLYALGGSLGLGMNLTENFSWGTTLKGMYENLGELSPLAIALDVGVQSQATDEIYWGAVLENLGLSVAGHQLPLGLRLGAAWRAKLAEQHLAWLSLELEPLVFTLAQSRFHFGLEYVFDHTLFVRAGYQFSDTTDKGLSGITAGLGIQTGAWKFGYTFAPQGDLGTSHRISVGLAFLPFRPATAASGKTRRSRRQTEESNEAELPVSPNAAAFGTIPSRPSSGLNTPMVINKEETAMRALMKKNLQVRSEIKEKGQNKYEVLFQITRQAGARVVRWRFSILDRANEAVRAYQGEELPETLTWDGKDGSGKLVKEPDKLQYSLLITDINGQEETDQNSLLTGANRPSLDVPGEEPEESGRRVFPPVLFDVQRADITGTGAQVISTAADYIKLHPKMKVYIEGYTDSVDEGDGALMISKARAEAVARYLTAYHNVSIGRILLRSRGSKNPAVSNDDPKQRHKNRRVIITVR